MQDIDGTDAVEMGCTAGIFEPGVELYDVINTDVIVIDQNLCWCTSSPHSGEGITLFSLECTKLQLLFVVIWSSYCSDNHAGQENSKALRPESQQGPQRKCAEFAAEIGKCYRTIMFLI